MRFVKRLASLAVVVIMAGAMFTGCGNNTPADNTPTSAPTSAATSTPAPNNQPKVLKLYLSNGTSLDPHIWTWGTHFDRMGIFEGLTKMDNKFKAVPANAEKWEHNTDYTVWTFHLRKDLMWSDGTPLTAKDYEYSMKRVIDPNSLTGKTSAFGTGVPIKNAEEVKLGKAKPEDLGIKAIDDYTLEITLSKPSTMLDVSVAESWGLPVPKHVIDKYAGDWSTAEHIVSNGPYKVKEWQQNAKVTLIKNDKYYGESNFDQIEIFTGTANQLLAYQNGDINIANVTQADMDLIKKDATLASQVKTFESGVIYHMDLLKSENDILQKNVKVRQAIAMSIDKEMIARDIMLNTVRPGYSLVPEIFASWGKDIGLKYDPAKAKQLMAEAGFPEGKGFPEITLLMSGTPSGRELAIKDMIEKGTGIKVKILNEEWAVFTKDIQKLWSKDTIGYFISGWGSGYASYMGYFSGNQFDVAIKELDAAAMKDYQKITDDTNLDAATKNAKKEEIANQRTSENGKKYRDLLKKADAESDPAKKEVLYKEAAILRDTEACTIALDWENGVKLIKPELKGYVGNPMLLGTPPLYFDSISMDSAK